MLKSYQTIAAASVAALISTGAFAQRTPPASGTESQTQTEQPSQSMPQRMETTPERRPGAPPASAPGAEGGATMAAKPSPEWVGKDVVNAEGDKIGEVERVIGDEVVVSVGGFLGIGEKKVKMKGEEIVSSGSGDDLKLTANMTKSQIENLPEYTGTN